MEKEMVVLQLPSLSRATAIKIGITAALQHCSCTAPESWHIAGCSHGRSGAGEEENNAE